MRNRLPPEVLDAARSFTRESAQEALERLSGWTYLDEELVRILKWRTTNGEARKPREKQARTWAAEQLDKYLDAERVAYWKKHGGGSETHATYSAQATTRTAPTPIRRIQG